MGLELIAALALGMGAGGLAYLLRRLTGSRLPAWIVPGVAAAAMIMFSIWSDYDWAPRTVAALPDEALVIDRGVRSDPWRPWTYLFPVTNRIAALDPSMVRRHEDRPSLVLAEIVILSRQAPQRRLPMLVDCARGRSAPIASPELPQDLSALDWTKLEDEAMRQALCPAASGGISKRLRARFS